MKTAIMMVETIADLARVANTLASTPSEKLERKIEIFRIIKLL